MNSDMQSWTVLPTKPNSNTSGIIENNFDVIAGEIDYEKPGLIIQVNNKNQVYKSTLEQLGFDSEEVSFEDILNKELKSHTIMHTSNENKKIPIKNVKYFKTAQFGEQEKYDIYTDDENQANSLITNELIEVLKSIKTVYNAQKMYVSFYGKTFYLGLYTYKKLFK